MTPSSGAVVRTGVGRTRDGLPYIATGDAPSLVVLNGGQGFVRRPTPARLRRDAARVAAILPAGQAFVLLGYHPAPPAGLSIAEVVECAAVAIAELAGDAPVDLVGVSYGGMIACHLAACRPDRVRRLVLVASGHRFSPRGAAHVRRQVALLDAGELAGFARAFAGLFRCRWRNWLIGVVLRLGRRRVDDGMAPAPTIVRYLEAMLAAPPADLAAIAAPALVIGGSADQFFGDGVTEEAARGLRAGELRLLAGETHMAPVEAPAAFRAALASFLRPVDA